MFRPVALQRSKIVAITELCEQVLQDSPVAFTGGTAIGVLKMILEVVLDPVVVKQGVVNINKENKGMRGRHSELRNARTRVLNQVPPTARRCKPLDPNRLPINRACSVLWLGMQCPGALLACDLP